MNYAPLVGIALWALLPGFIAQKKGRNFWAYYLLSFIITPLITTIITLCLRKVGSADLAKASADVVRTAKEKSIPDNIPGHSEPKELPLPKEAETPLTVEDATFDASEAVISGQRKIQFCRRCGFKLIDGSEFCSRCGTEIKKEDHL